MSLGHNGPVLAAAARIAIAFVAVFFLLGVHIPFFPVWLDSRGLGPEAIGIILSLGPWMRVVSNPLVGRWADRSGRLRLIGGLLAAIVAGTYLAFSHASGFFTYVLLAAVLGASFSPLIPLTDALAVRESAGGGTDYGRTRRWGSAAFIAATLFGGYVLEGQPESFILWTLVAAGGVIFVAMQGLPEAERRRPSEPAPTPGASPLRSPAFRLLCATTLCLHASHAVLYGFASTTWRFAGIDEGTIGWLWAVGVVAEIGLFTWARAVGRRLSPALLLAMAGLGGVLRWPILAVTVSVPILFASSLLHAATFAAMHLGAMEFIRAHVPPESTARATAIYSATSGIALGLGLPIAGALVDAVGQQAFFAMAVVSGAGLVLALLLDRRVRARAC